MTRPFDPTPVAQRFWDRAGATEPFPRRLTPTIAAILPVAVVLLSKLTVATMTDWLARRGAGRRTDGPDRPLRGCLIAQRGHGFIFVDGSLAEDEQRLTLAHETAHFVHHYEAPRLAALEAIGGGIEPVLNGDRAPTPREKLMGVLRDVPLGVFEHTMDRADDGLPTESTARFESEADLVAFELLAPASLVARATRAGDERRRALQAQFGLPAWAASRWGLLIDSRRRTDGFIDRLSAAREKMRSTSSNLGPSTGSTDEGSERKR